jgi:HrpA-like RNA helicase
MDHRSVRELSNTSQLSSQQVANEQMPSNEDNSGGISSEKPTSQLTRPNLDIFIQDDLLMTFDKDAREGLTQANLAMKTVELHSNKNYGKPNKAFSHSTNPESVKLRNIALLKSKKRAETSTYETYRALRKQMMALPVRKYGNKVLNLIKSNTYSILVAETGSGKSTQLPQLILDDAIASSVGARCRILCVQPRQIAATSLARRVARERSEKLGDTVGYSIRFDHCHPPDHGFIKYCTTGILLNILKGGPASLDQFSHIILDEVHVRDVQIDVVMMLLKRAIEQRQSIGANVPKVILMSATVSVDLFASYLGSKAPDGKIMPAPHLTIPGRTFEVKRHYLEEVVHNITHSLPPDVLSVLFRKDKDTALFLNNHFKAFDNSKQNENLPAPKPHLSTGGDHPPQQYLPTQETNVSELAELNVPSGLISATILSLLCTTNEGSILAFVPGIKQINLIASQMKSIGPQFGFNFEDADLFKIIRLHSEIPNEHRELSVPAPPGCRRIIIATDIAEASLTIPDVRFVVDSGKANQMNYITEEQIGELTPRWISKSAALQRAGRAGRTQAGDYYFLGSSQQFENLRMTKSPEITRANLEELCLLTKRASLGTSDSISDLLGQTLEPPSDARIHAALESLKDLQALDDREEFTGLGHLLEKLDMDPFLGKLVVLGIIFRCLDPMVILASLGSPSKLFQRLVSGLDRKTLSESRSAFNQGLQSSHMVDINAYRALRAQSSEKAAAKFAHSHCMDYDAFMKAKSVGHQILAKLHQVGLINKAPNPNSRGLFGDLSMNANSNNENLVKALLVHSLSPKLAVKRAHTSFIRIKPGVPVSRAKPSPETAIYAFARKWSTRDIPLGISDLTQIRPLAACLLTRKLELEQDKLVLDSWLNLRIKNEGFSKEEISENLIQQHQLLNDVSILPLVNISCANILQALHTAFEALPNKDLGDWEKNNKYISARKNLFTNLENTMELIVNMDIPRVAPKAPQHWEE